MKLDALFTPGSVAVIGSAAPGKIARVLLERLVESGFEPVYAVNPKAQGIGGAPGYPSVQAVGRPVDLAVIAAPAPAVVSALTDCGLAGVRAAAIITSGFGEAGNLAGEAEVLKTARKYGIRYIGPNCAGLCTPAAKLTATLETCPPPGRIGLISQSGAVGGAFMALAAAEGVGVSKFVSFGNGSDLGLMPLMEALGEDDATDVIALYLETVREGRAFMALMRSVARKKPVVAVKSGRTASGQRAALSHTGSMAGSDQVFDAALRQCGGIRAATLEELFDLCKGFASGRLMAGSRVAIVTNSGGPGVMTADRADELGLRVPEITGEALRALQTLLPPHAGLKNPVDLTVEGTGEQYEKALDALLTGADAAVCLYVGTPYLKALPVAEGIAGAASRSAKPVFSNLVVGTDMAASLSLLREKSLPAFESGERAVSALSAMARYAAWRGSARPGAPEPAPLGRADPENRGWILEPEAAALLEKAGIPMPPARHVRTREEAARAALALGFPVALKVVSPDILHKSEAGGVLLGLMAEDAVAKGFDRLESIASGADFRGALVVPMLPPGHEVMLGVARDRSFGPVVAFGMGGIYAEVLRDVQLRAAPVDEEEAVGMIRSIRAFPILQGVRGRAPADLAALAAALAAVSRLPFLYPDLNEADLNPVFVSDRGLWVADVRMVPRATA